MVDAPAGDTAATGAAAARAARRRLVEDVFAAAAELAGPAQDELVERACGDDRPLADEVRSLLAAAGPERLDATIAAALVALAAEAPAARLGASIGRYRLLSVIGEGGMGTVYLAERDDAEYRRQVAIKVLRNGLGSSEAVARFRDERQLLAQLDHPSIVRLLDGGTTDSGLPYLVMEHVDGVPVTEHARGLSVRRKVELVRAICGAVQHAHQKLIVHRDLKPANLLVDRAGAPKLLDFGIAKLLDDDGPREARTRTGMALLTAEYAAPEQARGEQVSVATDVYALGAVCYQLLVGAPPQRAHDSFLATVRAICDVEPARPSVAAPASIRRELIGDLDNIVMKALEKAPAARYPSVAALADDLERYLGGLPVTARATTFTYRAGKFVRRHRGALALGLLIAVALASATVVSIGQARRADEQRAISQAQTLVAEAQTRSLLLEQARQELRAGRASRALPYLAALLRGGEDTPAIRFLLAEALRPLELERAVPVIVKEGLVDAVWSPDGATVALAGWGGVMLLADRDLHVRARLASVSDLPAYHARFTADGHALIAVVQATVHQPARRDESRVRVWDASSGAVLHTWPTPDPWIRSIAVGTRHVAIAGDAGGAALFDVAAGVERLRIAPGPDGVTGVALVGGERWLALGPGDGTIGLRAGDSLAVGGRTAAAGRRVSQLATTAEGLLLVAWMDGTVQILAGPDAPPLATVVVGAGAPIAAPGPGRFATLAARDASWRLWDLAGHSQGAIVGGPRVPHSVAWSPDGARLALSGDDTFQVWDLASGVRVLLVESFAAAGDAPHAVGGALSMSFSPDGHRLLTASGTEARLWSVTSAPLEQEVGVPFGLWSARWSPDERTIAVAGSGAALLDGASGEVLRTLDAGSARLQDVAWSHDGRRLVTVGYDGTVIVFAADGQRQRALAGHRGTVTSVAWSPDDRTLATAAGDGAVILWDVDSGERRATLVHPGSVSSVSWSADGTQVVTAGAYRTLRLWDVARGETIVELAGGHTQYLHAALSPDGARLASAGHDGEVTVWELATGARRSLDGHTGPATLVEWSPDGALLATAGDDGTIRVWDPARGEPLAVRSFPGTNLGVQWSHDGRRLLGANHLGGLRVWSVAREQRSPGEIAALARALSPWDLAGTRLVRAR
jgi:WD40 repeat protein